MTTNDTRVPGAAHSRPSAWRILFLPAVAFAFVAGVTLAAPAGPPEQPMAAVPQACLGQAFLPPGHPPIPDLAVPAPSQGLRLPPGHPPVDGRSAGLMRPAPPLAPNFDGPSSIDL